MSRLRSVNTWLALLTLCLVFAATAGVRVALATRTEALRQTLAAAPQLSSTIAVAGTWQGISTALVHFRANRRRRPCPSDRARRSPASCRGDLITARSGSPRRPPTGWR